MGDQPMPYRPITPIKGPGIVAVSALYDEQEAARHDEVVEAARARAAAGSRSRATGRIAVLLLAAAMLAVAVFAVWPRSAPGPTPTAVASLAALARGAPTTTTFDGQRYYIGFTPADPSSVVIDGRMYATSHGYSIEVPASAAWDFTIAGPHGGLVFGYFDDRGQPNTGVRLVVAASDLTSDGNALR